MLSSDTIRADLEILKQSRCYAASAEPAQCPHRTGADVHMTETCARCRLACDHVMELVAERVWSVASEYCNTTCREDIAADVTAEFVERLVSGKLLNSWTPTKPILAIASRDFIYKRIVSAARASARQHRKDISLDVVDVQVEYADNSGELESFEIAERQLHACLRPHTWTGNRTVELVTALELFPILREQLSANLVLLSALRSCLVLIPSQEETVSYLSMLHSQKTEDHRCHVAALGEQALKSRTDARATRLREQMEALRLAYWLTPFDAEDLQGIMGLTRANADKRLCRYRAFLANTIGLTVPDRIGVEAGTSKLTSIP